MPAGLVEALESRRAAVTSSWREHRRSYLFAQAPEEGLFARWSDDPEDEETFAHEVEVRAVVGAEGPLRSPPVLEHGADWVLERAIEAEPCAGPACMEAVSAAAGRLAGLELPEGPPARREPAASAMRRRLRVLASPLSVADLRRAKSVLEAGGLPLVTSHGDFHPGNVLYHDGALWVVDWELSGRRPAGYDLMHFWATTEGPGDRDRLLEASIELVGPEHRRDLLLLRYAVVVRAIAAKLSAAMAFDRDPEGAGRLLELLPAVRAEAGLE